jgi:hypothetical protein
MSCHLMQETKAVFEKLYKFIGKNIKNLIDRPNDPHCFRLHKNKVFYVKEKLMKKATNVSKGGCAGACGCVHRGVCTRVLCRGAGAAAWLLHPEHNGRLRLEICLILQCRWQETSWWLWARALESLRTRGSSA